MYKQCADSPPHYLLRSLPCPPTAAAAPQRCPVMCAGPQFEYHWADGVRVRTPLKLCAPDDVNCLFDWVEEQVGQVGWRLAWGECAMPSRPHSTARPVPTGRCR